MLAASTAMFLVDTLFVNIVLYRQQHVIHTTVESKLYYSARMRTQ